MASQRVANTSLSIPRRLLEGYLQEAAAAVTERQRKLGEKIKQARDDKRWKQKQLAAAVHVEPMTVSRWERGANAPDVDTLELVAEATGKPLTFFFEEDAGDEAAEATLTEAVERAEAAARRAEEAAARIEQAVAALERQLSAG